MIRIDKDVPLPDDGKPRGTARMPTRGHKKYPWWELEIGHSFLHASPLQSVHAMASREGLELGRRFCVRQTKDGVRVWRVA